MRCYPVICIAIELRFALTRPEQRGLNRISAIILTRDVFEGYVKLPRGTGLEDAIGKYHELVTRSALKRLLPNCHIEGKPESSLESILTRLDPCLRSKLDAIEGPTVQRILDCICQAFGRDLTTDQICQLAPQFILRPNIYRGNRLDTGDLQVILPNRTLRVSLKALSKHDHPVLKNPGIGKILGPQFFDSPKNHTFLEFIKNLRQMFESGKLEFQPKYVPDERTSWSHANVLLMAASKLCELLDELDDAKIKTGIERLLDLTPDKYEVIAYYDEGTAEVHKLPLPSPPFQVLNHPSPINVSILWPGHRIALRVKFASGTDRDEYAMRWSSLKLAVTLD